MSRNRTKAWLTAWVIILLAGAPAFAQGVRDMAVFGEADLSTFGGGIRPREGLFFTFDWLYWGINASQPTFIGDQSISPQTVFLAPGVSFDETNTVNTGDFLKSGFTGGVRIDFGAIMGHHGWLFSAFELSPNEQSGVFRDAHVLFKDQINTGGVGFLEGFVDPAGAFHLPNGRLPRLPTIFNYLKATSEVAPWGCELNYLYRAHPLHHHGLQLELFAGARYLEFNDSFRVQALDSPPPALVPGTAGAGGGGGGGGTTTGGNWQPITLQPWPTPVTGSASSFVDDLGNIYDSPNGVPAAPLPGPQTVNILADSYWNTYADNRIVAPQVGMRLFRQRGRWTISAEGRAFAGLNNQNFRQDGMLGSKLDPPGTVGYPLVTQPTNFAHWAHFSEFSPGAELRVQALVTLTKTISIGAGWNGLWVGNVARAANVVDYQMPTMGFTFANRNQDLFINGLNVNLTVNR